MLYDNHGRQINYMRLAVTDRCNLRCFYCMPEEGIKYVPKKELLSFEEMVRVTKLFAGEGISKLRITGGEPFLRKDMMDFLKVISAIPKLNDIHITTNGTLIKDKINDLKSLGIKSVNLSLDSISRERFHQITRRDELPEVMDTLYALIDSGIETKINMVVMANKNIDDIIPMVELAKNASISVRFIEEMPFNGTKGTSQNGFWSYVRILEHIKSSYPKIAKLKDPKYSTSMNYSVEGFKGDFGIIAAYSRTFCGSCNRIRMTPQGSLKTCLYDSGVFNVRDMMRNGAKDSELIAALKSALSHRAKDGFEAEAKRSKNFSLYESMSTIGG